MTATRTTAVRLALTLAAAAAALALVPVAAQASTWFGSSLNHEPSNSTPAHPCGLTAGNPLAPCTRVGAYYPGTSGRVTAPRSGRIVAFRVRAGAPGRMTFKIVRVRGLNLRANPARGQAKAVGRGPTVNVKGRGFDTIERFGASLRVHKGDEIAIDSRSTSALYCSNGTTYQLLFRPLAVGGGFRSSITDDDCLLMVQAVIG